MTDDGFIPEDDRGLDDKVLAVPLTEPGWNKLDTLPEEIRASRERYRSPGSAGDGPPD